MYRCCLLEFTGIAGLQGDFEELLVVGILGQLLLVVLRRIARVLLHVAHKVLLDVVHITIRYDKTK